jgi:hypothetical protein
MSDPVVWIHDANNPRVLEAIASRRCELCKAPKGEACHNTINVGQPLPGRAIHFARLEA